jgi:ABC-type Mn2+/Zn2+ transport systems, permease components
MFELLSEMLKYPFIQRALIVGLLVALCASLLGVSLVLKRYAMIGDGLSHVGFGALAIATALKIEPLMLTMPVVLVSAFLLLRISENSKIKGDSAIALISTASLAIGVIVISETTGLNTDVCNYLFGSILAIGAAEVPISILLSVAVIILFVLCYNKIFAVTFDETFAKATGTKTAAYNMLIASLTAVTIVVGMRLMGAMLISSLIIFPSLTAMRLCKRFKTVVICSAAIAVFSYFEGIVISYSWNWPAGASVVAVNLALFLMASAYDFCKRRVTA